MKPAQGVTLELAALVVLIAVSIRAVIPFPFSLLAILVAQALSTILIHCPAHYVVGRILGIRFSRIRLGRSTLSRALPRRLKSIGRLLIVPNLFVDGESKRAATAARLRAMYISGILGSVGAAIAFALMVTLTGSPAASSVTWFYAIGYLASDLVLSPKSGDLSRARVAKPPMQTRSSQRA